jgi:hypothetical protein
LVGWEEWRRSHLPFFFDLRAVGSAWARSRSTVSGSGTADTDTPVDEHLLREQAAIAAGFETIGSGLRGVAGPPWETRSFESHGRSSCGKDCATSSNNPWVWRPPPFRTRRRLLRPARLPRLRPSESGLPRGRGQILPTLAQRGRAFLTSPPGKHLIDQGDRQLAKPGNQQQARQWLGRLRGGRLKAGNSDRITQSSEISADGPATGSAAGGSVVILTSPYWQGQRARARRVQARGRDRAQRHPAEGPIGPDAVARIGEASEVQDRGGRDARSRSDQLREAARGE